MNIILFGAPGSGKGTQASMLAEDFSLKRVSLGDILRENVKNETPLGKEAKEYMEKGVLVPDELVARLVEENIDGKDFILDGYPRNAGQAKALEEILRRKDSEIGIFIYLDIDENTIIDRLSKRRICKSCGMNYHLDNMPPKKDNICDKCSGELVQRKDDSPDVIKKRWEIFEKESRPIIDFYKERDKLLRVEGKGNKDQIFAGIKKKLQ